MTGKSLSSKLLAEARRPEAILERAALFAGVPAAALAELAAVCQPRWLDDRGYLFHAGEPANQVFFLAEGQLEVVGLAPEDRELVLNTLDAGAVVGELAVLRGEARSAGVRAKGRALVHGLDAAIFVRFVQQHPQVAIAMARSIAESFVRAERRVHQPAPSLTWLVAASPSLDADFALALARAAQPYLHAGAQVVVRLPGSAGRAGETVEVLPLSDEAWDGPGPRLQVALVPPEELSTWCRRATGAVAAAGTALPPLPDGARRIEVVSWGPPSALRVRMLDPPSVTAGRVARLLLRRSVGVALGGGAARAWSELGVLQVMETLGVPVDFVAGTSMGSLVGAVYLANGLENAIESVQALDRPMDWARLIDPKIFLSGMIEAKRLARLLQRGMKAERIEQLPIPFAAVALDLDTGDEHVIRSGRITDAFMASMSIPGVFAPFSYQPPGAAGPSRFVDGGVVNNIPVDVVRAMGADRVVGIHAMFRRVQPASGGGGVLGRLARLPAISRALTVLQSQLLAVSRSGERQVLLADVAVLPETSEFGFIEFWRVRELIEAGRQAALRSSAELQGLRV